MSQYYPVTICRSDGLLEVSTKAGIELNQPTPAQLDDKPDAKGNVDYYRRLSENDTKAIDWRRKIGGMLMNILGGKSHADRNYILTELPDGYVLWEHIKYNKNKGLDERKREKGKHAAGMYDRQDAYLYGHPQGRKKRYRSPADFFPHLLWLGTDRDGDSANCSCKICSPDGDEEVAEEIQIQPVEIPVRKEIKAAPPAPVTAPVPFVATPSATPSTNSSGYMSRYTSTPTSTMPPKIASKPVIQLPTKIKSKEQLADSEPTPMNKFIYRPGELVWFNNGANWRLGVISKRNLKNNQLPRYLIQPLSNPEQQQPLQIKEQDYLRPWLAWSVPETTNPDLKNLHFEQVSWDRVVRGEFDNGRNTDYVVDGSILAAKSIDASYSLFDRIENALVSNGDIAYNGMFLGAEKVWVGEPVRLSGYGSNIVILIIDRMVERPGLSSSVTFTGDIYKLVEMPTPHNRTADWPKYSHNLPPRMITDIAFRNEVAAKKGIWYEWQLLATPATKQLKDIKGRWYETQTLLPILKTPHKYQADLLLGQTSDAGEWMNGRKDNNNVQEQRRKNRRDTLGRAVPADFKVSRGLDGPPDDDQFPDEHTMPLAGDFDNLDHFMDLEQAFYGTGL
ncbi:unnamed protein product [Blumeria hordei]|uniref:Uncharacterized protein n=2 Tax=Blumeria hordei TaxID=2867405 RepID=A0A383UVX2_BLUHO|nr:Transcription-silencing protein [Blumeria hordei DH14]SZF03442.1 unnamed protein product [Blumeria hordei]